MKGGNSKDQGASVFRLNPELPALESNQGLFAVAGMVHSCHSAHRLF